MTGAEPPIVGIVCMDDRPEKNIHGPRFSQNQTYAHAIGRGGAVPLLVPLLDDLRLLRAMYDRLDGLLLPGGVDIHPRYYGEPVHEKCGEISELRDRVELALIRWAIEDRKPILAICRGIQVLNVALGGSLYQDIAAQVPEAGRHDWHGEFARDYPAHPVEVNPDTRLGRLVETATLPVNSLHHQAIKDTASGLVVAARAPDGLVEAVEISDFPFCLGVQWHPEELAPGDARAQKLFDEFVKACR